jgi:hypothetical protein
MNKGLKTFIAVLGGVNVAFSIFIPIAISLLLINTGVFIGVIGFTDYKTLIVLGLGVLASLYRAINVGFLRN